MIPLPSKTRNVSVLGGRDLFRLCFSLPEAPYRGIVFGRQRELLREDRVTVWKEGHLRGDWRWA